MKINVTLPVYNEAAQLHVAGFELETGFNRQP
jgi:hypothetical protein